MGKKRIKRFVILSLAVCTFLMSSLTAFAVEDIPLETDTVETDSGIFPDITNDTEDIGNGGDNVDDDINSDVTSDATGSDISSLEEIEISDSESETESVDIVEKLDTLADTATSDSAVLTEISARVQSIYEKLIEDNYFFSKDFTQYTVTEGLLLLIFIVLLAELFLKITANLLHWRMF